jgi:hypothetical protein
MIAELVAKVTSAHPRVGLELQWELTGDDDDLRWELELHVLVEIPGREHSRYSSIRLHAFPGEELEERRAAHRIAFAVAERTRMPLYSPALEERGGEGGSNWIRRQPTGAATGYEMSWHVEWWTPDATVETASGTEVVASDSGEHANWALSKLLQQRFSERPLSVKISTDKYGGSSYGAPSIGDAMITAMRTLALHQPPSRVARLVVEQLAPSPRDLALAFCQAFTRSFQLERFVAAARWRRGEIDDAALDAELAAIVDDNRSNWDRPRRLREAKRAGKSVAATVREELALSYGMIAVIADLREAFEIGLGEAKLFVDEARNPGNDARLDASLPDPKP